MDIAIDFPSFACPSATGIAPPRTAGASGKARGGGGVRRRRSGMKLSQLSVQSGWYKLLIGKLKVSILR